MFVNGREIVDIGAEDLILTSNGYVLNASVDGLRRIAGDENAVSVVVTFANGEALTTELKIAGTLPRSIDLLL